MTFPDANPCQLTNDRLRFPPSIVPRIGLSSDEVDELMLTSDDPSVNPAMPVVEVPGQEVPPPLPIAEAEVAAPVEVVEDVPVPVADVCTLTWYCEFGDIHSRTIGYGVIAKLIVGTLPNRKH